MNSVALPVMIGIVFVISMIWVAIKRAEYLNEINKLRYDLKRIDTNYDTIRATLSEVDKSNDILRNDLELALIASGKSRYDFLLGIEAVRIEKKCGGKK
jgi:hypothetical protein